MNPKQDLQEGEGHCRDRFGQILTAGESSQATPTLKPLNLFIEPRFEAGQRSVRSWAVIDRIQKWPTEERGTFKKVDWLGNANPGTLLLGPPKPAGIPDSITSRG